MYLRHFVMVGTLSASMLAFQTTGCDGLTFDGTAAGAAAQSLANLLNGVTNNRADPNAASDPNAGGHLDPNHDASENAGDDDPNGTPSDDNDPNDPNSAADGSDDPNDPNHAEHSGGDNPNSDPNMLSDDPNAASGDPNSTADDPNESEDPNNDGEDPNAGGDPNSTDPNHP